MKNLISLSRFVVLLVGLLTMCVTQVWGEDYSFTIQTSNFNTTSYAANNGSHDFTATCTTDSKKTKTIACTSNQVMQSSSVMQWQSGNGYIYNTTDLGTIKSVTVNSSAGTFTTNYGTSEHPTSGTTVGNGFFTVKVGNATGKTSSIVVVFDDGASSNTPTITKSSSMTAFSTVYGTESTAQSFTVGGTNLTADLVVTAPTGFELCKTSGGTYSESVSFSPAAKTVSNTSVYVRIKNNVNAGTLSAANITCTSTGATTQNVSVSGKVQSKVNWSVNGSAAAGSPTLAVDKAGKVSTLPTAPTSSDCDNSKVFVGWTDAQIASATDTKPSTLFTAASGAPAVNANEVTYYATFATSSGSAGTLLETVGFESSEGYTNGSTYNSSSYTTGSAGSKWKINYGAFATTGAIIGSQSAQFRIYNSGGGYGQLMNTVAYASDITKVVFSAKAANSNGKVKISYSANGSSWTDITTQSLTTTTMEYTAEVPVSGAKYIKFTAAGTKPSSGNYSIYVDGVKLYNGGSTYTDYITECVSLPTYAVTFSNGDKGTLKNSNGNYSSVQLVKMDNIVGWTHSGWGADVAITNVAETKTYAKGEGIPAAENIKIEQATNLTAQWTRINYTVSWNKNGGDDLTGTYTNGTKAYGTEITPPNTPTRTGYTFEGWHDGTSIVDFSSIITVPNNNVTFTAQWTAKTTTVTLDNQSATTAGQASVTATYGQAMPSIASNLPAKNGYAFGGYFTEENGAGTQYYNADGTSATTWNIEEATKTLYAKWTAQTYAVTYYQNTGTGTTTDANNYTYGQQATAAANGFTKEGYDFTGWNTMANGLGTSYAEGDKITMTGNVALYAQWQIKSYDVKWWVNGSQWGETVAHTHGAALQAPGSTPQSSDCDNSKVFVGWTETSEYANATTAPGDLFTAVGGKTITSNKNYYAVFATQTGGGGGSSKSWTKSDLSGQTDVSNYADGPVTLTLNDNEWTVAGYGIGSSLLKIGKKQANYLQTPSSSENISSITVTWYSTTTYYLTVVTTGGTELVSKISESNDGNSPQTYTFSGWSGDYTQLRLVSRRETASDGNALATISAVTVNYGAPTTYSDYATACSNNRTVTYDMHGHGDAVDPETVEKGEKITNPGDPSATGYTFGGWYKEDTYTNQWNFSTDVLNENRTLHAKWTAKQYTVNFDQHDPTTTGTASTTATYDAAMPVITIPVKTGYKFNGYWTGENGTGTQYYDKSGNSAATWTIDVTPTTLHADWIEIVNYTITWSVAGNTDDQDVFEAGDALVLPAAPAAGTCPNKVFKGWTENAIVGTQDAAPGDLFTTAGSKTVTANKTYYAVFATETAPENKEVSLNFNQTTNVYGFPTNAYTSEFNYEVESGKNITFHAGTKVQYTNYQTSYYVVMGSFSTTVSGYITFPALSGYKLIQVKAQGSSSTGTAATLSICGNGSASSIAGGAGQTFSKSEMTWNLTSTAANTAYDLYIIGTSTAKDIQFANLYAKYAPVDATPSCGEYATLCTSAYNIIKVPGTGTIAVTGDLTEQDAGESVSFTVTPNFGYTVSSVDVTTESGSVEVTETAGVYSFTMPSADVMITPNYTCQEYKVSTSAKRNTEQDLAAGNYINVQTGYSSTGTNKCSGEAVSFYIRLKDAYVDKGYQIVLTATRGGSDWAEFTENNATVYNKATGDVTIPVGELTGAVVISYMVVAPASAITVAGQPVEGGVATVKDTEGNTLTEALPGTQVILGAEVNAGYLFTEEQTSWVVTKTDDASAGPAVTGPVLAGANTGKYYFTMPNYPVTVTAGFTACTPTNLGLTQTAFAVDDAISLSDFVTTDNTTSSITYGIKDITPADCAEMDGSGLMIYKEGTATITLHQDAYEIYCESDVEVAVKFINGLTAPTCEDATAISATGATFTWNQITNNQGYCLVLEDGVNPAKTYDVAQNVTTKTVSDLAACTTYKYYIIAKGDNVTYANSAVPTESKCNFTTTATTSVNMTLNHVTWVSGTTNAAKVCPGEEVTITVAAEDGYDLPWTVNVTAGGDVAHTWNATTGVLTFTMPSGNVTISMTGGHLTEPTLSFAQSEIYLTLADFGNGYLGYEFPKATTNSSAEITYSLTTNPDEYGAIGGTPKQLFVNNHEGTYVITAHVDRTATHTAKDATLTVHVGGYMLFYNGNSGTIHPEGDGVHITGETANYDAHSVYPYAIVTGGSSVTMVIDADASGKVFVGWNSNPTCSFAENTFTMPNGKTVVNAMWEMRTNITVYANNGAEPEGFDVCSVMKNTAQTICYTPTKTGYEVEGYYTDRTTGTKVYNADGTMILNNSPYTDGEGWKYTGATLDLYAHWTPIEYTITFKDEDETVLQDTKFAYNTMPTYNGATPTKDATAQYTYTFAGWTPTIAVVTGEATYTATYNQTVRQYTVSFVRNGHGSTNPASQIIEYGRLVTDPAYDVPNYDVEGWYTDPTDGTKWNFATDVVTGPLTLYAHWVGETYNITYKDRGDVAFSGVLGDGTPLTHTYGTATPLVNPTKTGYTFNGWYYGSMGGSKISSVGATAKTEDFTLYAQWTANTYTITLDNNNSDGSGTSSGTATATYDSNTLTSVSHATRTGYNLDGYYTATTGGVMVVSAGGVLQSNVADYTDESANWKKADVATLYAHWNKITLSGEVKVTSTVGKTIASGQTLLLSAEGLNGTETVSVSSENSAFTFSTTMGGARSNPLAVAAIDGAITNQTIYVHYTPTFTEDGTEAATIVAKRTANDAHKSGNVTATGRHLPERFVIAAKVDGAWYALTNMNTTTSNGVRELVPVTVDNASNPTTATVYHSTDEPAMAWTLVANNAVAARYGANGDKMLFTRVIDDKGLAGNNEGLRSSAQIPASGDSYVNWAWNPTTTDLANYTLENLGATGYFVSADAAGFSTNTTATNIRFLTYNRVSAPTITWRNEQADEEHKLVTTNTAEDGRLTIPIGVQTPCSSLFEFVGWTASVPAGGLTSYFAAEPALATNGQVQTSEAIYRAVFKETRISRWYLSCPNIYTITYDANGGTGENVVEESTTQATITNDGSTFSRDGYILAGWCAQRDGQGTIYKPSAPFNHIGGVYSVTLYAIWMGELTITGDVHLTSGMKADGTGGVTVYATENTGNLITIACAHTEPIRNISITYLDAEDNEISTNSQSLFRLCNDGTVNYNIADNSGISFTSGSPLSQTYSISYTPNAAGCQNAGKIRLQAKNTSNQVLREATITLYGRSLPEQFAIVMKDNTNGMWYALPNVLGGTAADAVPDPLVVSVDNASAPTKVTYASASVLYKTDARMAATSHRGAVRLQSVANNYYLTATKTDNTSFYTKSANDDDQQFYLTSSDLSRYTITLDPATTSTRAISMNGGKIGWFTTATKTVYLLPVEDTPNGQEMDVADWKVDSSGNYTMVFNVTNWNPNQTLTASVNDGAEISLTRTTDRTVDVPIGQPAPDSRVDVSLRLDGAEKSRAKYRVPFILNGGYLMQDGKTGDSHIIVNSGEVIVSSSTLSVREIWVQPGAKLTVGSGKQILVDRVLLRGEAWVHPNLKNDGTIKAHEFYYTRRTSDKTNHYQIGVPYAVDQNKVKLSNDVALKYMTNWTLKYYDAAARAESGYDADGNGTNNWEFVQATTVDQSAVSNPAMAACKGYEFWSNSAFYREYYFPFSTTRLTDHSVATISLTSPTGTAATENPLHGGWNYIVSPVTYDYKVLALGDKAITDPADAFKFAEIYEDGRNYYQFSALNATIRAFSPFYFQASTTGTMTFGTDGTLTSTAAGTDVVWAPMRGTGSRRATQWLQIDYISDSTGVSDQTSIYLNGDRFTEAYEVGYDVVKMATEGSRPTIYTAIGCGDLAFAALPDTMTGGRIPMAVYATESGQYTFSLVDNEYLGRLEHVYLIDTITGQRVDLLSVDYSYLAEQGTTKGRFYIQPVYKPVTSPDLETGVEVSEADLLPKKIFYQQKLYILRGEHIYDGTGKQVK